MNMIPKRLRASALALACMAAFPLAHAAHVDPRLTAASGDADALIILAPAMRPLSPLAPDANYKVRRAALVDALRAHAQTTQQDVRAWLDANGIAYRSYWIANVIEARLPQSALAALGARDDVLRIESNVRVPLSLPAGATREPASPEAISWGVTKIDAISVWAAGFNGQGVVVAGEDTGYQWDHPALQPHYRGWDGATADHNYNWHDSIHDAAVGNSCGSDSPEPCDDAGHGTHTAGTFAGDDGATHQTGVAPGAKWIGCRNMDGGNGTPARYIECMQWMLAPTDLAGANPNPDLAPDVINNSWGCPASEGCTVGDELEEAVDNVVAGGILFVASAANDGPDCETIVTAPATYDSSFVIGATDTSDRMAGFSSRGPVVASDLIRPDLSAPGVNVLSSLPPNTYGTLSGTSMAAPHVTGTVALMLSVAPEFKGDPARIKEVLRLATIKQGITDPSNDGCGGLTMNDWPNYQAGYGRIDAYWAAQYAQALRNGTFADGFDGVVPGAP